MAEYLHPGVYVERKPAAAQPIEGVGTSTAAFVGVAERGKVGVAELVTSWEQYKAKFAYGLQSPFYANSYLAYSVFGFFANGGSRAYVVRVASSAASKASATLEDVSESPWAEVEALDEGAWGNDVAINLTAGDSGTYNLTVKYGGEEVETFRNVSISNASAGNYIENVINGVSRFITISVVDGGATPDVSVGDVNLSGGSNGESGLAATDYEEALAALDNVEVNMVAIPGTNSTVPNADTVLKTYVEGRGDCVGFIEPPLSANDPSAAKSYRDTFGGSDDMAFYYPWVEVADPIGSGANPTKVVPPCGHVMGVCARTDGERGVWKAPAGIEASVLGITGVTYRVTEGEQDILNPAGINVVRPIPNAGIVIWGARTLSPQASLRYLPVVRTLKMIDKSLYNGLHFAVFEPNNEDLWRRMRTSATAFLLGLFRDGAFAGTTPEEAFLVKCDGEINDQVAQDAGRVYIDVGVALVKPSEFVIIRVGQKQMNS